MFECSAIYFLGTWAECWNNLETTLKTKIQILVSSYLRQVKQSHFTSRIKQNNNNYLVRLRLRRAKNLSSRNLWGNLRAISRLEEGDTHVSRLWIHNRWSAPVVTLLKVIASEALPPRAIHIRSNSCSLVNRYWSRGRIWANPRAALVRGAMDTWKT